MKLIATLYPKQGQFGEPLDDIETEVEFNDVEKYEVGGDVHTPFFTVYKANGEIHATRSHLIKSFKLVNE